MPEKVTREVIAAQVQELVEAARAYRDKPAMIFASGDHYESDEISCSCGFVSQAADYEVARASLRRHINKKTEVGLRAQQAITERFDAALAVMEAEVNG